VLLRILSVVSSAVGVAIVMGHEPSNLDLARAGVCFVVAVFMCLATELGGPRAARERTR
jgi:hypothetical protein